VVDRLLSDEKLTAPDQPGDVYWALGDNLNTIRDIARYDPQTDTTTIVNHRVFDAFGNITSETNAAVDLIFAFTGRLFDDATGLQNNLHRWYDPTIGRWLSEDPIGFTAGDTNLYRYVNNGPTMAVDPTGELVAWYAEASVKFVPTATPVKVTGGDLNNYQRARVADLSRQDIRTFSWTSRFGRRNPPGYILWLSRGRSGKFPPDTETQGNIFALVNANGQVTALAGGWPGAPRTPPPPGYRFVGPLNVTMEVEIRWHWLIEVYSWSPFSSGGASGSAGVSGNPQELAAADAAARVTSWIEAQVASGGWSGNRIPPVV
jgi:RHS repeat-associated protein